MVKIKQIFFKRLVLTIAIVTGVWQSSLASEVSSEEDILGMPTKAIASDAVSQGIICVGNKCYFTAADIPTDAIVTEDEILPTLTNMRVLRTLSGAVGEDEFLAFLEGREARCSIFARALALGGPVLVVLALLAGGFLLNLTPCVLPLLPVNMAILGVGATGRTRRQGAMLGAAFGGGIAVSIGLLGLLAGLAGVVFGTMQSSAIFNAVFAIIFALLALFMLDALHLPSVLTRRRKRRSAVSTTAPMCIALFRAFTAGVGSALLSSACVAPVLVSAIVFAVDLVHGGHKAAGMVLPFVLGLGMALPWPLVGGGVATLPKPGAWMNGVKYLFAAVFLAAAAYYMHGAYKLLLPVDERLEEGGIVWLSDVQTVPLLARATGEKVLLSLSADWCRACHEMDRTTLHSEKVVEAATAFLPLRVDCTNPTDPEVKSILRFSGGMGLPHYAILEATE